MLNHLTKVIELNHHKEKNTSTKAIKAKILTIKSTQLLKIEAKYQRLTIYDKNIMFKNHKHKLKKTN